MERSAELYLLMFLCVWLLHLKCGPAARGHEAGARVELATKAQATANRNTEGARPAGSGPGVFAAQVPEFKLKDPAGGEHKSAQLHRGAGMLLMLTVPNLSQYEKQVRWNKFLKKQPWPAEHAPRQVLLEDLSQQTLFKDRARAMMADKYDPNGAVTVLIDEDGGVRRGFRVPENETVILLVDPSGNIIHHEATEEMPDAEAARRVMKHVTALALSNARQPQAGPALEPRRP